MECTVKNLKTNEEFKINGSFRDLVEFFRSANLGKWRVKELCGSSKEVGEEK